MENIPTHLEQRRAKRYFWIIVSTGCLFIGIVIWQSLWGSKTIAASTLIAYHASTCCSGYICSKCLFSLPVLTVFLEWTGPCVLVAGIIMAVYKSCIMIKKDRELMNGLLPGVARKIPLLDRLLSELNLPIYIFYPFQNDSLKSAFTAGIFRPRIFLSTGICKYLTIKELRLVILHELYHYREKGPLKNFVIYIIKELFFFVPFVHLMVRAFSEAMEEAADDHVIAHSESPVELASALIKIGKANLPENLPMLISPLSGFQRLEKRIYRLLGFSTPSPMTRYKRNLTLSTFILLFLSFAIFLQVTSVQSLPFLKKGLNTCYHVDEKVEYLKDSAHSYCCKI